MSWQFRQGLVSSKTVFDPSTGGSIPANPATIFGTNLVAWYDPTRNFSGSTWNDQSGNANNLTSVGSPTFSSTSFNGRPGVTLNGTSQYYSTVTQTMFLGSSVTSMGYWMVLNPTATPSAFGRFIATIDASPSNHDFSGTNSAVPLARNSSTTALCGFASAGATPLGSFAISYGTNYIASAIFDGTNFTSYLDNVQQTQTASSTPTTWGTPGTQTLGLCIGNTLNTDGSGNMTFGSDFAKGVIAEVVVTKGTVTSQNRIDMEAWLKYNNGL